MPDLPSGTVTFLFTDIERSTENVALLGDEHYAELLDAHRKLLREAFAAHRGHEVGTEGDSFFVAFKRAQEGVAAAIDSQRLLAAHPWPDAAALRVRMGVHTGDAVVRQDDYVGHDVHKAKRICDAGHGGQILLSQTTADLVGPNASLTDLGFHRLKDLGEAQRLFQLSVPGLQDDFPRLRSLDAFQHNLPLQRSTFVGRQREIADVRKLLENNRLLTLTGVGGCGKTRLALQVGAELLDVYADGVFFVDLAPISDPDAVVPAIAGALGVPLAVDIGSGAAQTARPERILLGFLSKRSCLVILDNCEHLVDGCADIADAILSECPDVSLLATSREGLSVEGEQSWHIPSLSVPSDPRDIQDSESVSLFKARAQAVRPDFELTPQNADAVVEICRRLDGIPLAIEFAAARISHLPPQEIADRLGDMFRLLTGRRRRVQRQQTLQAALDWSYELLSDEERTLLRRLAVFAGSFTIPAVEGICADDTLAKGVVLDLLGSLVAKSLVLTEDHRGEARYRLIETVRIYASEKLREAGESDPYRARHRDWYGAVAEAVPWEEALFTPLSSGLRLVEDHPNLRAALEWSEGEERLDLVMRMAARVFGMWSAFGHTAEGYRWLTLARPEDLDLRPEERCAVLTCAAFLGNLLQDAAAQDLHERAIAAAEGKVSAALVRAKSTHAVGLAILGEWARDPSAVDASRRATAEALEMAKGFSIAARIYLLNTAAINELLFGNSQRATELLAESLATGRTEALAMGIYAVALHLNGDHEAARRASQEFLDRTERNPTSFGSWNVDVMTAPAVAFAGAGDTTRARKLFAERLETGRNRGRPGSIETMLVGVAALAHLVGDPARAARLLAWVRSRTFDRGRILPSPFAYGLYQRYVALAREALGPEEARRCRDEGRAMSEDDAVSCAWEIL